MRFVIDLDSLYLIESTSDRRPVSMVSVKRGDDAPFEVIFVRSGIAEELAGSSVLTFGAKEEGKFDGTAVVLNDEFALSGSGTAAKYLASPSFNTVALNDLFAIDGDDSNDVAFVDLIAEFTWQVGAGAPTTTKTFRFRVHNDVIRGTEGTPLELPTPEAWLIARQAALEYAGADPNIPENLTVTGSMVAASLDAVPVPTALSRTADVDGLPAWSGENSSTIQKSGGLIELQVGAGDYLATNTLPEPFNPAGQTYWTEVSGTGQPTITGDNPIGEWLGQLCKAATAWWRWNGSLWIPFLTLAGEPVAWNATLSAYRKITVTGADGSEIITMSAL